MASGRIKYPIAGVDEVVVVMRYPTGDQVVIWHIRSEHVVGSRARVGVGALATTLAFGRRHLGEGQQCVGKVGRSGGRIGRSTHLREPFVSSTVRPTQRQVGVNANGTGGQSEGIDASNVGHIKLVATNHWILLHHLSDRSDACDCH